MDTRKIVIAGRLRLFILFLILSLLFTGCAGFEAVVSGSAPRPLPLPRLSATRLRSAR